MKLTEQIRARLKATGLSQNALHKSTGLTRATIAKFLESGDVHSDTLDKIYEFLGGPAIRFPAIEIPERKPPGRKPKASATKRP